MGGDSHTSLTRPAKSEEGDEAPSDGPSRDALPRILVADDNPRVRSSIAVLLGASYDVETVSDGAEALLSARARLPDLILCDIVMPNMDGFALLREVRKDPALAGVPLVLLSARSDEEVKLQGLEAGADDYLAKPFTPRELMGRIGAHLKLAGIRKREAKRQYEARKEAEEANVAKTKFLAMMSHELRTPLNAIAGYVEILQLGIYGPVTAEQHQALDRIQRSQRHVLSLMNDMLAFAKIEAGRTRFALSEVSLEEALSALETMIAPQLTKKKLRYRFRPCSTPQTAWVDPDKLRQVMLNLLSNAIKFTPREGEIELSCDSSQEEAHIRVKDTGPGIPEDQLERIFEAFVQVDPQGGEASAGVGLGLAISRDLARAMGGTLSAESIPGRGSVFTLSIPRKLDGPAIEASIEGEAVAPGGSEPGLRDPASDAPSPG